MSLVPGMKRRSEEGEATDRFFLTSFNYQEQDMRVPWKKKKLTKMYESMVCRILNTKNEGQ